MRHMKSWPGGGREVVSALGNLRGDVVALAGLEEGVAELRGVLIDRGYIQGRKKRRLSRKQKKVAKKVKKLQEKLKKNDLDVSEEEV